jgi:hypothetical protein
LRKSKDWIADDQFNLVNEKIAELTAWLNSKIKEREETPATSDPILTKTLIKAKIASIKVLIKTINSLEKPKVNNTEQANETKSDLNTDL